MYVDMIIIFILQNKDYGIMYYLIENIVNYVIKWYILIIFLKFH